jgi:hypothetical protein
VALPVFGVLHLVYPESVASLVPPWYPWPMFWAYFTGFAQLAGGVAIVVGILPRPAATLAGVMYGSWALTLHIPRTWCHAFGPCELLPEVAGLQGLRPGLTSLFVASDCCPARRRSYDIQEEDWTCSTVGSGSSRPLGEPTRGGGPG